jgi:hypothetical protein
MCQSKSKGDVMGKKKHKMIALRDIWDMSEDKPGTWKMSRETWKGVRPSFTSKYEMPVEYPGMLYGHPIEINEELGPDIVVYEVGDNEYTISIGDSE